MFSGGIERDQQHEMGSRQTYWARKKKKKKKKMPPKPKPKPKCTFD